MTRLLFVHGIAQEGKSSKLLADEWLGSLNKGLKKLQREPITAAIIPFYGDVLAAWTRRALQNQVPPDQRNQGLDPDLAKRAEPSWFSADPDFSKFAMEFAVAAVLEKPAVAAQAMAASLESRAADAASNADLTKRGIQNWPPIIAAIRALDGVLPNLGQTLIQKFLQTTHCYLTVSEAFDEINHIVNESLGTEGEPTVVVGHSLGSVVSYHVLHSRSDVDVPMYITLGSPLAVGAIKARLRVTPSIPTKVIEWYNAFDSQDIVALNPLDDRNFSRGIENYSKVKNCTDNHHGIVGYLDNETIVQKVIESFDQKTAGE